MKISIFWAWYDFWVGIFWDSKRRVLYICPLPTIVIKIQIGSVSDPMENHKCRKIAEARMGPGREEWIGELLEPIPGHEIETHCWHIKTPYKSVVFGIMPEDLYVIAVFAEILNKKPINPRWLSKMAQIYQTSSSK